MENSNAYEWNEAKRQSNLEKHGVDFADVCLLEWAAALSFNQIVNGETRTLAYAPINSRLFAVVFTMRGNKIRVISFRKANDREMDRYEKETD